MSTLHDLVPRVAKDGKRCPYVSGLPHVYRTTRCTHDGRKRECLGACGKLMRVRIGRLTGTIRIRRMGHRTTLLPRAFTTFYKDDKQDMGV